jgi:hypothetical protein
MRSRTDRCSLSIAFSSCLLSLISLSPVRISLPFTLSLERQSGKMWRDSTICRTQPQDLFGPSADVVVAANAELAPLARPADPRPVRGKIRRTLVFQLKLLYQNSLICRLAFQVPAVLLDRAIGVIEPDTGTTHSGLTPRAKIRKIEPAPRMKPRINPALHDMSLIRTEKRAC